MVLPRKSTSDSHSGALRAAMTHPIRAQILAELGGEESQSAAEVAARIDVPVRSVRHQLSRLAADGLVEMSASRGRRGALEKLYRVRGKLHLESDDFERMSPEDSRRVTIETFRRIVLDVTHALDAGRFAWKDSFGIRVAAEVDEEGWEEIGAIGRRTYEEVEAARARAAGRLETSEEAARLVTSVLLWFERPRPEDLTRGSSASSPIPGRRLGVLPGDRGAGPHRSTPPSIAALAEAMGHPVRAKILFALSDSRPLGVAQIAERVHEPKRRVRYQVGRLVADDLVERLPGAGRNRVLYGLLAPPFLGKDDVARLSESLVRRVWTELFRRIAIDI